MGMIPVIQDNGSTKKQVQLSGPSKQPAPLKFQSQIVLDRPALVKIGADAHCYLCVFNPLSAFMSQIVTKYLIRNALVLIYSMTSVTFLS